MTDGRRHPVSSLQAALDGFRGHPWPLFPLEAVLRIPFGRRHLTFNRLKLRREIPPAPK